VNGGGFASVIAEVMLGSLYEARDGGDVDDGAREAVVTVCRGLEEMRQCSCHEGELGDVGAVGIAPIIESGVLVIE